VSAYAGAYLLGAPPSRIFGMTAGAGLIYSDDESCSWGAAGGVLSDVLPYAFTVDPSNDRRVYAIGAPRANLRAGDGIYLSDDAGITFGEPTFTAPAGSPLLTISVAPSQPSTLFATMFSGSDQHPILLRSRDFGAHWERAADLEASLGQNPFELVAIHPLDERRLYARVLKASAEALATSDDGGLSFVESISIPGKLSAFLRLASGTILIGGTSGTDAMGYRSRDDARSFEPWPEAPHVHALAERHGKLYIAADPFADGYVLAESNDEGAHVKPLSGFQHVRGVMSCATDLCAERCAYYAGIQLWPATVCAAEHTTGSNDEPFVPTADESPDAGPNDQGSTHQVSAAKCALGVVAARRLSLLSTTLLTLGAGLAAARRMRRDTP
jgi:hypothetical protein